MHVKTFEAIKGHESLVLSHYNLPQTQGNRHFPGECPLCSKRKKFRLTQSNGRMGWICVCGNGSIIDLVMQTQGLDYKNACNEIDKLIGNEFKPTKRPEPKQKPKAEIAMTRFTAIHTLFDSPVEAYLKSRGIIELPQLSVKFAPAEYDHRYKRSFPAMYAVATDESMNIVYTHKTYLDGGKKADVDVNKKMETMHKHHEPCGECGHEYAANVAVRMFEHGETLGISEGIESALSAKQLFGFPCWSVLNTSIMKAFKAPKGVINLIIYADNDKNGAGLAAAFECGHKNLLSNNDVKKVTIRVPSKKGADFNDMLNEPMDTNDWFLG